MTEKQFLANFRVHLKYAIKGGLIRKKVLSCLLRQGCPFECANFKDFVGSKGCAIRSCPSCPSYEKTWLPPDRMDGFRVSRYSYSERTETTPKMIAIVKKMRWK